MLAGILSQLDNCFDWYTFYGFFMPPCYRMKVLNVICSPGGGGLNKLKQLGLNQDPVPVTASGKNRAGSQF